MTLVYRTTGAWGSGIGRPVTWAELDGNFYDHALQLAALSAALPAAARGISDVTVAGNQLSFTMSDLSTEGPFTLPEIINVYKGVWAPSTSYVKYDRFTQNGSFYEVLFPHVSGLTFSPTANDGNGHDYYALLMTNPGATLPTGGPTGYLLVKVSNTDFDFTWLNPSTLALPFTSITGVAVPGQLPLPTSSTIGAIKSLAPVSHKFLTSIGSDGLPVAAQPSFLDLSGTLDPSQIPPPALPVISGIIFDTTLDLTYANSYVPVNAAGDITVTIPPFASVAWVPWTEITFRMTDTGSVTFVGGAGVTLNIPAGFLAKSFGRGATMTIKNVSTNHWDIFGLLATI